MFFVLSGFLITTLLLQEWCQLGKIRLGHFYARRAARLFPALALTIVGVYVVYTVGDTMVRERDALLALPKVLLYVGNWFVASANGGHLDYLSHTWSLAIEEQFYLLYPLVLLTLLRRRWSPARIASGALAVAIGSELLRVLVALGDKNAAYYRSDTRAGALMLGCAVAVVLATPAVAHGLRGWHPNRP